MKTLLRTLFQFDVPELDFGIYRIMNYRRKEIEEFIEKHLVQAVENEFQKFRGDAVGELEKKLEEKRKEIERMEQSLGEKILKNGEIEEKFKERPFAKEYLELMRQLKEAEVTESIKIQVFNDLYNFFSRYYEDGDFISKRRLSFKQEKYAIPYNGEEVKLHWATADQYYVKTDELFKDYEFMIKDWRIVFRTIVPELSAGNTKEERRYFVLAKDQTVELDRERKICTIRFEYRRLTDEDLDAYGLASGGNGKKVKQDELNLIYRDKVLKKIHDEQLVSILSEKEGEKMLLDKHLFRYTRKNTADFFIHKNLKGFLERELDYFIKTEVVDLNNLEARHITRAKVIEAIGKRIIEFLAQIEDFQKMLWEKKKFVLRTDYVITLGKIEQYAGESFLQEILTTICSNTKQVDEWADLFGVMIKNKNDLLKQANWKNLPVDTRHFDESFKAKLLEALTKNKDLDEIIDGVLAKSENWQALNLLVEKYRDKVQTIYIDPPFNKEQDADYLYNVKYKDATWITMLENRLWLAKKMLKDTGGIFVRCDYNGNMYVRMLMNEIFGEDNFRNEIVVQRGLQTRKAEDRFLNKTDSLFFYFRNSDRGILKIPEIEKEHVKAYRETLGVLRKILSKEEHQKLESILNETLWMPFLSMPGEQKTIQYRDFFGIKLYPPKGRHWAFSQENLNIAIENEIARLRCNNCGYTVTNKNKRNFSGNCPKCGKQDFTGEILSLYNQVSNNWTDIPGYEQDPDFPTRNSEILLKRVIESTSNVGDLVVDFFLGSGTTTAVAHKLKRKWIGVEMGEHFWTIVLPRMKKVLFYDTSGISKEKDVKERYNQENAGGFFKYHYLEQYEDSLHNIDLVNEEKGKKALEVFGNTEEGHEYLMKYFLRYETKGSPSLLNVEYFKNPFEYKLKIISNGKGEELVAVDLIETFNYLIGLHVSKYKFVNDNGRKYVFVFGRRGGRKVAVVWRPTDNIDLEKDRELIENMIKDYIPDEVFINGDALIDKYRAIESEFKVLMGVGCISNGAA